MTPIPAHGGELLPALGSPQSAAKAPTALLSIDRIAHADLMMFAVGAYSPLRGFMGAADRTSVAHSMQLSSGILWPIPITLGASAEEAKRLRPGMQVGLVYEGSSAPMAAVEVTEIYESAAAEEARLVYGTDDPAHPGVKVLLERGPFCVAGPVVVFSTRLQEPSLTCAQTRASFAERQWQTVVGFQTRNPVHRAHEYIIKCAMEITDGLLLHPLVGATKDDDIPADVRMDCYKALIEAAMPPQRVLLSTLPAPMRYAGPREAIMHAIVRQNYGCTHFIVGRDHAGVGKYYGTYDAQKIFGKIPAGSLKITPLFFEHSFYCRQCGGMGSSKTCPHGAESHVTLSGTRVRELLQKGERPPAEFSRAEVADILIKWAKDGL